MRHWRKAGATPEQGWSNAVAEVSAFSVTHGNPRMAFDLLDGSRLVLGHPLGLGGSKFLDGNRFRELGGGPGAKGEKPRYVHDHALVTTLVRLHANLEHSQGAHVAAAPDRAGAWLHLKVLHVNLLECSTDLVKVGNEIRIGHCWGYTRYRLLPLNIAKFGPRTPPRAAVAL